MAVKPETELEVTVDVLEISLGMYSCKVTDTVLLSPFRRMVIWMVSPTEQEFRMVLTSSLVDTSVPLMAVIQSPDRRPAFAAAELSSVL